MREAPYQVHDERLHGVHLCRLEEVGLAQRSFCPKLEPVDQIRLANFEFHLHLLLVQADSRRKPGSEHESLGGSTWLIVSSYIVPETYILSVKRGPVDTSRDGMDCDEIPSKQVVADALGDAI